MGKGMICIPSQRDLWEARENLQALGETPDAVLAGGNAARAALQSLSAQALAVLQKITDFSEGDQLCRVQRALNSIKELQKDQRIAEGGDGARVAIKELVSPALGYMLLLTSRPQPTTPCGSRECCCGSHRGCGI